MNIKPIIIIITTLISCGSAQTNWLNFKSNNIVWQSSETNAYSGYQTIFWKFDSNKNTPEKELLDYASNNNWELINKSKIDNETSKLWGFNFPLSPLGYIAKPSHNVSSSFEQFPLKIRHQDMILYSFRTNTASENFKTSKLHYDNGFILCNHDFTEIQSFFIWGQ